MSYHLNAATEPYSDDDNDDNDELDGRPTIPFMHAIPHLMPPLPTQDELDLNDPPTLQVEPESANAVVPVPEAESEEQPDTTTFIPGTNVAMWPLPSQDEVNTETRPSATATPEDFSATAELGSEQTAELGSEQAASPNSAKSSSLRPWFVGTFTVLFLEAALVATANLYRSGYLSFVW